MKRLKRILVSTLILVATTFAAAQLTVDATGPIRERRRQPTGGSGGSIGRKLPVRVSIEIRGTPQNESVETFIDFILTNSGRDKLTVPISANPGDFEPADPDVHYTVSRLSLYITSDTAQSLPLLPETNLYGSEGFSGTLATLAPGESLRVLAHVKLPFEASKPGSSVPVFVAHMTLNTETIKTVRGRTVSDTKEIGAAASSAYTAQALLGSGH